MSLDELLETHPNHQSRYLANVPLDDFAMVGLTERYAKSVALFESISGRPMPRSRLRRNVNPRKDAEFYEVSAAVRRAVDRRRPADVELYRPARARFAALCAAHGVV